MSKSFLLKGANATPETSLESPVGREAGVANLGGWAERSRAVMGPVRQRHTCRTGTPILLAPPAVPFFVPLTRYLSLRN